MQYNHITQKKNPQNFCDKIRLFFFRISLKRNLLILQILKSREKALINIQKMTRRFLQRNEILKFFEKKKLFYQLPFAVAPQEENQEIYLAILYPPQYKNKYLLKYCKYRNLYVAYLSKDKFDLKKLKKIYFKFKLEGKDCIDPNYVIVSNFPKGNFYNKLDLSHYEEIEKNFKLHMRKKTCEYMKWMCERFHRKMTLSKMRRQIGSRSEWWGSESLCRIKKIKKLKIPKERNKMMKLNKLKENESKENDSSSTNYLSDSLTLRNK